jgi:uncharacterized membrane protein
MIRGFLPKPICMVFNFGRQHTPFCVLMFQVPYGAQLIQGKFYSKFFGKMKRTSTGVP